MTMLLYSFSIVSFCSPDSLVLCENMSAQGAMVAKLRGTLVTIVGGALVLRQLVPPQVALVCERGLAQVALPSNLGGNWVNMIFDFLLAAPVRV